MQQIKENILLILTGGLSILVILIAGPTRPGAASLPGGQRSLYLPLANNGAFIRPQDSICPAGMHLRHQASGALGIDHPDDGDYRDADYFCAVDRSCDELPPNPYGECRQLDGYAVYACAEGYVGAGCNLCAPGYTLNSTRDACIPAPSPPEPVTIAGLGLSINQGDMLELTATHPQATSFHWEISNGPGCFLISGGDCAQTATGRMVTFQAPNDGDTIQSTEILVTPDCCGQPPPTVGNIITIAPDSIPVTGEGSVHLEPVLRALLDFMQHRCVGGATLGVSFFGATVATYGLGRMDGAPVQFGDPDCGNDPYLAAPPVPPDEPLLIGSVSKSITAAITRWQLRQSIREQAGLRLSDDEIEGLLAFAENPGVPVQFFPDTYFNLYSGLEVPPVFVPDSFDFGGDTEEDTLCETLTMGADPQWQEVTIGQLLAHRTGIQRSAPGEVAYVVPALAALRELEDAGDFAAQEQLLRDIYGDALVDGAIAALGYPAGTELYITPHPTLTEIMTLVAGRCLRYNLNSFHYSNTDPAFWTAIVEELRGESLAGENGNPTSHDNSALDDFFATLGVETSGDSGIFATQTAVGIPGYSYPGPVPRGWNGNSYYTDGWDRKRPHCVWNGGECDYADWQSATNGRVNWVWQVDQVPFPFISSRQGPGTGSFRAAPEPFLTFLNNYWVGGYGTNPRIGQSREGIWNVYTRHNGSLGGGYAWGMQLGSTGGPTQPWALPPVSPSGHITDEFVDLSTTFCPLPNGVDIYVAVAQRSDRKCVDDPDLACDEAYGLLDNFVLHGVCQVNWAQVLSLDELVLP